MRNGFGPFTGMEIADEEKDHHHAVGYLLPGRHRGRRPDAWCAGAGHSGERCTSVRLGAALLDALRDGAAPVSSEAVIHDLAVFVRGCTDYGHRDGVVFGEGGSAEGLALQDDGGGEGWAKAARGSGTGWAT